MCIRDSLYAESLHREFNQLLYYAFDLIRKGAIGIFELLYSETSIFSQTLGSADTLY